MPKIGKKYHFLHSSCNFFYVTSPNNLLVQIPGRDRSSLHTFTLCFTQHIPSMAGKKEPTRKKKKKKRCSCSTDSCRCSRCSTWLCSLPQDVPRSTGSLARVPVLGLMPWLCRQSCPGCSCRLDSLFPFCSLPSHSLQCQLCTQKECSSALGELNCRSLQQESLQQIL